MKQGAQSLRMKMGNLSWIWKEIQLFTARLAAAYPGFRSTKRPGVFLFPLDGMLVHRRSLPRNLLGFPNNSPEPIYTPKWRKALWELSVLPKNTTQCPQPGLEPGPLAPRTNALTISVRTRVKVRKTKLIQLVILRSESRREYQCKLWTDHSSVDGNELYLLDLTTLHVSVVWIEYFYKKKAPHHKQRQFNCWFLLLFYLSSIISAFVANIISFIEALARFRIEYAYFAECFIGGNLAKLVALAQFLHYYCYQW